MQEQNERNMHILSPMHDILIFKEQLIRRGRFKVKCNTINKFLDSKNIDLKMSGVIY